MAKSCCRSTLRVTVGCCAAAEVAHEGAHPQRAATATAPIIPSIEFLNIFSSSLDQYAGRRAGPRGSASSFLLDDREHLAVTGVHQGDELLVVRLPVFVAHDPGRRTLKGC